MVCECVFSVLGEVCVLYSSGCRVLGVVWVCICYVWCIVYYVLGMEWCGGMWCVMSGVNSVVWCIVFWAWFDVFGI